MRIGYPCINRSLGCSAGRTFRLAGYSDHRLVETVERNLDCLEKILRENAARGFLFHRISSDIVPFASHPVCTFDWQSRFDADFSRLGKLVRDHGMRISMHPDQFTLINSPNADVFDRSVRELGYHADVLDLMGLDPDARIQIHVGGIYGDKQSATDRFIRRYQGLDERITRRLAIENDDRLYTFADCTRIHERVGVPVIFDNLHHRIHCSGETLSEVFAFLCRTWADTTGIPMTDYSEPLSGARPGRHAEQIDTGAFSRYLSDTAGFDFDIMLEIKDKEKSAAAAIQMAAGDPRLKVGRGQRT